MIFNMPLSNKLPFHIRRLKLAQGFAATTALLLLSLGMLAFFATTLGSAILYADGVERREVRIQKRLNQKACKESLDLMKAKDYFLQGTISLPEFDCSIDVDTL